jgi:hypothetical protein
MKRSCHSKNLLSRRCLVSITAKLPIHALEGDYDYRGEIRGVMSIVTILVPCVVYKLSHEQENRGQNVGVDRDLRWICFKHKL